jgi:hypothetical protein
MLDVGLRPDQLLGADRRPARWIEHPQREDMPVASAVADGDLSPCEAAPVVNGQEHRDRRRPG